jgi:tellurite resistance protein TehA-like permease
MWSGCGRERPPCRGHELTPAAVVKQVFLMTWLWAIFAGFYLVAYIFWVPRLFGSLPVILAVAVVTLLFGAGFLLDGFLRALELQTSSPMRTVPLVRVRRILGGALLLGYLSVYLPPQGRIVAHWPLDLAITAASGIIMIVYGVLNT